MIFIRFIFEISRIAEFHHPIKLFIVFERVNRSGGEPFLRENYQVQREPMLARVFFSFPVFFIIFLQPKKQLKKLKDQKEK